MITDKEQQIRDSFVEKAYREALAVEHVNTTLAIQIRQLREQRYGKQAALAQRLGKHQETISQWENPDYGRYSLTSLKKLAAAFDVALLVKFISFNELAKDMVNLSPARLCPSSFNDELAEAIAEMQHQRLVADKLTAEIDGMYKVSTATADPYDVRAKETPHVG